MLFGEIERTFSSFEHSPEIHTLVRLPALPFVEKGNFAVPLMAMLLFFRMRDEFGGALVARFCDTGENDAYVARLIGSWRSNGALRSALRVHFRRRQTVVCEDGRELSGLSQLIENSVRLFGHR